MLPAMERPPSGVIVFADDEGNWILSANRVSMITVTEEVRRSMKAQAIAMTDMDEYEIDERIPPIGEEIGRIESANRQVESLEEAASIIPLLWEWIMGFSDDLPDEMEKE